MKLDQILPATADEKACIWDLFRAEEQLWDIEAELLSELRYYDNRIEAMGRPAGTADRALLDIYQRHRRRIERLLSRLPDRQTRPAHA